MAVTRILIVDDFAQWLQFVQTIFEAREDLKIIGTATDGMEAVQKAEELQPDLILLDIGLPGLNGLEAARQIRKLSPNSQILFCSQESSAEIVEEALKLGAQGYLVKSDASSELLLAIEAALQGKQFVSKRLAPHIDSVPLSERSEDSLSSEELSLLPVSNRGTSHVHEVASYRDSASFVNGLVLFVETAFKKGNPVIVITTETHRTSLQRKLQAAGWDIAEAIEQGSYISVDAEETLSTFMVNDWPDSARFFKVAGDLFMQAAKAAKGPHARVAACGECAPTLWSQGKPYAAIHLEHLWDEIARKYNVETFCVYLLGSSWHRENSYIFQRICAEHTAVYSH
jgi:DNA-binding NarL/FixJ family response regulator